MLKVKNSRGVYDPSYVSSWLCQFFPFDSHGNILDGCTDDETELQSEVQKIPFLLTVNDWEFLAGFVGLSQYEETKSIKPEIDLFIRTEEKNDSDESESFDQNEEEFGCGGDEHEAVQRRRL